MDQLDVADAKLHWDLCRYAYRDEPAARKAVEKKGLNWTRFYDGRVTQGFACSDGTRISLAFRGSDDAPLDWISNAQFKPVLGELGGHVHSGHRMALSEVWDEVEADVVALGLPVTITGHSLGAALATLAAARLLERDDAAIDHVYTFGQPRIGKRDFTRAYENRLGASTYRFVCHIDLVTRVPFMLMGYRHVGRRYYFDEDGGLTPDAGAWAIAGDDLKYRLKHLGRIRGIGLGPHFIPSYTDRMNRL